MSAISLRKLSRDQKGAGALELGLALPMLLMLLAGMIDMSRFISGRIDVEQAAIRATDYALAIRPADNKTGTTNGIKQEAATSAGVPTANVTVTMTVECDGVKQTQWSNYCTAGEDQARLINVQVTRQIDTVFDWQAMGSALGWQTGTSSSITVTGSSVVRIQ